MESREAESCFIEKRCRENMDPRGHGGAISRLEWLVHERAGAASEIVQGDIVAAISKLIVSPIVIHTFVILVATGRVGRGHIRKSHIGNPIKRLRCANLLALGNVDGPNVVAQPELTLHCV